MKKSVCFLSILALFLSVGISASAQNAPQSQNPDAQSQPASQPDAQQPQSKPAQPPDQPAPPANDSTQSSQSAGAQIFTGTIVKSGDKYTFQEEATGKTYDIDHQDQVQKFEGKKVKVHGTLDASANMIHVQ